jgi:hypothetical protein
MSIDRGTIDRQLDALGGSAHWWNERELRDLPAVLEAGEEILAISRGKLGRIRWFRRSWLIVATDARLLCLRSNSRTGWRQFELRSEQIRRVGLRIGPFRGRVVIHTDGVTWRLLLPRTAAYHFTRVLEALATPVVQSTSGIGPRRVVERVISHILAFPAAALEPETLRRPAPLQSLQSPQQLSQSAQQTPQLLMPASDVAERVEALEEETQELRRQVAFLEQLLTERQADVR